MYFIVQELGLTKIKQTIKDYFALYRSRKKMTKRLTAKTIRYAMGQIKKGTNQSGVAVQIGVALRHVRRLLTEFCATGSSYVPKTPERPTIRPSENKMQTVPDKHKREDVGILRVAMNLRNSHNIRYFKVYLIMKEKGLMISPPLLSPSTSAAKSGRQNEICYEQNHSNSMRHGLTRHKVYALSSPEPYNLH